MKSGKDQKLTTRQTGSAVRNGRGLAVGLGLTIAVWSTPAFAWNHLTALTNALVCPGCTVTFSTTPSGPLPYKFEWWKNGVVIPGQVTNVLTLTNVANSDAAVYSVKLTGGYDCVTNQATLTVRTNVSASPLTNQTVCPGATVVFKTTASGTGPFNYSWLRNGVAIPGQSTNSLTLSNVGAADAGLYSVVVQGACSSVTNAAILTLNLPVAATALTNLIVCPGQSAKFATTATGTGPFTYAWRKGGTLLAGQTGSALSLSPVAASDAGSYSVTVGGACGSSVSNCATLTVNVPVAATPLTNTTVCPGGNATFSTVASGTAPISFAWWKNGLPIPGATAGSLSLSNVSASDAATYSVVVIGACGSALTNSASLTVNQPPLVTTTPANVTVCPGNAAGFSVAATGTSLAYQWYRGTNILAGQTGSSLSLSNVAAADAGTYSVVISGACGSALTNSASLTVNQPPLVTTTPANVTVCPGNAAGFSVAATGTSLAYQWYRGTNILAGQTGSSLSLSNVAAADAGTYSVVISGACGSALTNSASLTVNQSPLVTTSPANVTVCPGNAAGFSVAATGTSLAYQWYRGTNLLAGQTGSSLSLSNVAAADAGTYSVVISGACGSALTNSASLTVNQSPLVTTSPANVTVCPGNAAGFSVAATGTSLAYQWYRGTNILAGQTGSSLSLSNVAAADAGTYSVVISGACGSALTNSATLTVNQSPLVTTSPANVTVCPGNSAAFNVTATGTSLAYQWYRGTNLLAGQTGSSLSLSNVAAADAGTYSVVISGACGSALTNSANLTVNQSPLVTTSPANVTVCPGNSAAFNVTATGTSLSYQWYRGTNLLAGQTGSSLSLSNVAAADAGTYSVVISGACGSALTNSATLTVNQSPLVTTSPANVTVCPGSAAAFSVAATGTSLAYQWYRGTNILAGQTGSSLSLSNVAAADAGTYSVVISGACGSALTNSANLTVNQSPFVTTSPANVTVCPGSAAAFSVAATGTSLAYQWYRGTNILAGQTGSSLSLSNVAAADAGTYSVVISGACGSALTNSANLTVNQSPLVKTSPANVTVCPGNSAAFNVTATGTSLAYQWYRGTNLLAGQTGSGLSLSNVAAADAGTYSVVISGACGSALTNSANLTVNQSPLVTTSPANVTVCPGNSAAFNVTATGTSLAYQWYRGTNLLAGQTGSSLSLSNVAAADAGTYSVVISGACGSALTNSANLTVNQSPLVTTSPANVTVCPGNSAAFNVTATGTSLSYQWYRGTNLLAGQTGSSLSLSNVAAADAGTYSVVISGACGSALTNSANLTVNQSPFVTTSPANVTVCVGGTAGFNVSAVGTALTYQWYRAATALVGQTANSLTLSNLGPADAGLYSVVLSGTCGEPLTNSASLVVQPATTATPLTGAFKNLGDSVTFSTVASGTGPFAFIWEKNGSVISGATASQLTLTNLTYADAATYTVQVSGNCGTVTQTAVLGINHPPTVTILNPTNGTVFLAPANFTVLADAQDLDGYVTKVEFFAGGTNKLGEVTNIAPYFIQLTNVPTGVYTFTARATDNLGATGDSAPVSVSVVPSLPISITSGLHLNYQTGFWEETARLSNSTSFDLNAAAVLIYNLPPAWRVQNTSFVTNGVPAVLYNLPVPVGATCDLTIKYFLGVGATTNVLPDLVGIAISSRAPDLGVTGQTVPLTRAMSLPDGSFLINFNSVSNAIYYVQYATVLGSWKTSPQPVLGTGYSMQWIDYGPPATDSLPGSRPSRFYRIIRAL